MKLIEIEKYKVKCILEPSDEESARDIIRSFEENVRKNMSIK